MAIKICLDAGHKGAKYNQSPVVSNYYESAMNWKLTNLLKDKLTSKGFEVILTRPTIDTEMDVYARGTASKGCDLFLSIHSNACGTESVDYPVVYRAFDNLNSADTLALKLAKTIQLTMGTKQAGKTAIRKNSSGGEYYGVLRGARAVGTPLYYIVEHSFHTNKKATEWLLNDNNLNTLAEAEVETIVSYYKELGKFNEQTVANDKFIWNSLKKAGYTDIAAAGIIGNLFAESGLYPNNLQNTFNKSLGLTDEQYTQQVDNGIYKNWSSDGAGYGLCQWTFSTRKQNLLKYVQSKKVSIGDIGAQVEFMLQEISTYNGLTDQLNKASTVRQASDIFMLNFERPKDQGESVKAKRAQYAQTYYDRFKGTYKEEQTNTSTELVNKPSNYAKVSWEKAIAKGITDGSNPHNPATREQIMVMFDRLGLLD